MKPKLRKPMLSKRTKRIAIVTSVAVLVLGSAAALYASRVLEAGSEAAVLNNCIMRMRVCHSGLVEYELDFDRLPESSGLQFLTTPRVHGMRPPIENLDHGAVYYVGRDIARYPIERLSASQSEPLMACLGNIQENHPAVTHVLYSDGAIVSLSLSELKDQGIVSRDSRELIIGPTSQVADLRKLTMEVMQ